jgi:hypothetical protein
VLDGTTPLTAGGARLTPLVPSWMKLPEKPSEKLAEPAAPVTI